MHRKEGEDLLHPIFYLAKKMWVAGNLAQTFTIIASAFSIFQDRKKRMILSIIRDDQEVFFFLQLLVEKY